MKPVRVTFKLRTPMVIPSVDKSLDSLLSWAAVRQAEFNDASDPLQMQNNTGLMQHSVGSDWCPMASNLTYDWIGDPYQAHYIKRSKLEDYTDAWMSGLLTKRPYFDGARGVTKAGSYLQPIRWVRSLTAFAVVEDMQRFEDLLPWVTHIGKLHHRDYGAVSAVTCVPDSDAGVKWAQRNLPKGSSFASAHVQGIGALRSPYWDQKNHVEIAIPRG